MKPLPATVTIIFPCLLILLAMHPGIAGDYRTTDTIPKPVIRLTARMHSVSFFNLGGRVAANSPAADLSCTIETKAFGYTIMKGFDLKDNHSAYNFALATVHHRIQVTRKIKFTPQLIAVIEQTHHIVGQGSDFGFSGTSLYTISPKFSLEGSVTLFNLLFERSSLDMVNRLRLLLSMKPLEASLTCWHDNRMLDGEGHGTGGLTVGYQLPLTKRIRGGVQLMAAKTFASTNEQNVPETQNVLASILFTFI